MPKKPLFTYCVAYRATLHNQSQPEPTAMKEHVAATSVEKAIEVLKDAREGGILPDGPYRQNLVERRRKEALLAAFGGPIPPETDRAQVRAAEEKIAARITGNDEGFRVESLEVLSVEPIAQADVWALD